MKDELLEEAKRIFPGGKIEGKIIDWMCDECFRTHHPDQCEHYTAERIQYWIKKRYVIKKVRASVCV